MMTNESLCIDDICFYSVDYRDIIKEIDEKNFDIVPRYLKEPLYQADNYEWFYIGYKDYDVPAAIICLTENRYKENSLHLSVFQVAEPIRGLGIGGQVIRALIKFAIQQNFNSFTLLAMNDSLYSYYQKFGLKRNPDIAERLMEIDLA
jgi:GNAT superfamily N-acetyltransferase